MAERGFVGVGFFFVLSGFLITTLLVRERDRTGRISLAGFSWRRALRILLAHLLPAYLLPALAVPRIAVLATGIAICLAAKWG